MIIKSKNLFLIIIKIKNITKLIKNIFSKNNLRNSYKTLEVK